MAERHFYALDFDRCLGDTDKLMSMFEVSSAELSHVSRNDLRQAREAEEAKGLSFDAVAYVRQVIGEDYQHFDKLIEYFCQQARLNDMLMAGARRLLSGLVARGDNFGIVTYGSQDWQSIKIKASNLESYPVFITENRLKGQVIAGWQDSDEGIALPHELAKDSGFIDTLTLIDDKPISFADLPEWADGIYVQSSRYAGNSIDNQRVIWADDLDEVCNTIGLLQVP